MNPLHDKRVREAIQQMNLEHALNELHYADPAIIAEKITGKSICDDKYTNDIWMYLSKCRSEIIHLICENLQDTTFIMQVDYFIELLHRNKFREVLKIDFAVPKYWNGKDVKNEFFVFFNDETGCILYFDTYGDKDQSVNDGRVYFNWESNLKCSKNINAWYNVPGRISGGFMKITDESAPYKQRLIPGPSGGCVLIGSADIRQGLFTTIRQLKDRGTFLSPWVSAHDSLLWLTHWGDKHIVPNYNDQIELIKSRFNMLPSDVREKVKLRKW